jgi:hypothetical protein
LFNFATLLEGPLTPLVSNHLRNLSVLPLSKLCIMTGSANIKQLSEECNDLGLNMCFHKSDDLIRKYRSLFYHNLNVNKFATYFSESFAVITLLKWHLLIEIHQHSRNEKIVFTDADIFWNLDSREKIRKLDSYFNSKHFFTQRDSDVYCTGIMIFRSSLEQHEFLKNILSFHMKQLESKKINDQDAFNLFVNINSSLVDFLDSADFLIGHQILKSLLVPNSIDSHAAIHANWLVGNNAKFRVINSLTILLKSHQKSRLKFRLKLILIVVWHQSILLKFYMLKNALKLKFRHKSFSE